VTGRSAAAYVNLYPATGQSCSFEVNAYNPNTAADEAAMTFSNNGSAAYLTLWKYGAGPAPSVRVDGGLGVGSGSRVPPAGAVMITDGITAPSAVAGGAIIYADAADGDLKVRFGDGTVKTLATDT
jgi:hypothetical protein